MAAPQTWGLKGPLCSSSFTALKRIYLLRVLRWRDLRYTAAACTKGHLEHELHLYCCISPHRCSAVPVVARLGPGSRPSAGQRRVTGSEPRRSRANKHSVKKSRIPPAPIRRTTSAAWTGFWLVYSDFCSSFYSCSCFYLCVFLILILVHIPVFH